MARAHLAVDVGGEVLEVLDDVPSLGDLVLHREAEGWVEVAAQDGLALLQLGLLLRGDDGLDGPVDPLGNVAHSGGHDSCCKAEGVEKLSCYGGRRAHRASGTCHERVYAPEAGVPYASPSALEHCGSHHQAPLHV